MRVIVPEKAMWFLSHKLVSDIGSLRLSNGQIIEAQMARFGISLSSEGVEGYVEFISTSTKITSVQDIGHGCEPLDSLFIGKFVVVRRGGCTFPSKAFWAQDAGALALLVVSDKDTSVSMNQSAQLWDINMEDGVDMTSIPCFYLSKPASDQLLLNSNSKVVLYGPSDQSNLFYSETKISNLIVEAYRPLIKILRKGLLYPGQSLRCMKKCMRNICC